MRNALAAAACAHAAGVPPAAIGAGLTAFRPVQPAALQVKTTAAGATLIDDSYNANPDSVRAAIDVLAACPGPRALVLGDMGEVGAQGPAFHAEVGALREGEGHRCCCSRLGAATPDAVRRVRRGRAALRRRRMTLSAQTEGDASTTVLVKGSRFMRMERVVAAADRRNAAQAAAH